MCSDLRVESSKLITEVTIEKSTIEEQQRQEEKILQEETESIITSKETKTIDQEKISEINNCSHHWIERGLAKVCNIVRAHNDVQMIRAGPNSLVVNNNKDRSKQIFHMMWT